jgi:hypothetical protein
MLEQFAETLEEHQKGILVGALAAFGSRQLKSRQSEHCRQKTSG